MALRYVQKLPAVSRVRNRERFIVERCRGKRVLHLGFVAQGGQDEQIASGQWLHGQLAAVAACLTGIDLDAEGVRKAQAIGFADVFVGDVENLCALPINFSKFEIIVAGELIEHVRNVGSFLGAIAGVLTSSAELLITTPNALSVRNLYFPITGREVIHPDHRCIFSPTTLAESLRNSGLCATEFLVYSEPWVVDGAGRRRELLAKRAALVLDRLVQATLVRTFPYFASGLIVVARKSQPGKHC